MDPLRNDLSNELNEFLTHADIPENIVDFVRMCSKRDAQIRARKPETKSSQWEGGYKKLNNLNN